MRTDVSRLGEANVRSTLSAQRGRDQTADARGSARVEQVEDGFDAE
ncbi:MAG: hypothetical protein ACM3O5_09370 [Betaproteobacteria bacterium]